ncbi:hypothetical protein [Agriterribacter sp.]|uniref:hypothetical protein n=1 Tax=Agriterribacter sp. TaxID=2821509 RepID=UPI002C5A1F89|nr:hypothetical protein [Agriterribacter sp.]HRP57194.1 hypothetical protein [Agriterribacter sp.]
MSSNSHLTYLLVIVLFTVSYLGYLLLGLPPAIIYVSMAAGIVVFLFRIVKGYD